MDPGTAAIVKIGIMVASLATTIAIAASAKGSSTTSVGPRLGDLQVSAATFGLPIPAGWGTVRLGGNMVWTSGIVEASQTTNTRAGGKGGLGGKGSSVSVQTFTYSASFAFAFAKGPANRILRIWADSKLVYDQTSTGQVAVPGMVLRQYMGTEDQMPDPLIEAAQGAGQTPAFRGLVYIVAENVPLEPFGNRIPNLSCEVAFQGEGHTTVVWNTNPVPFDDYPPQFQTHDFFGPLQSEEVAIDYQRGVIYAGASYVATTDGFGGIWVYETQTMQVTKMVPQVDLYSETGFGEPPGFPHPNTAQSVMLCAPGTDLFTAMLNHGTNRAFFTRINPESLKVTGEYGTSVASGSIEITADAVCQPTGGCVNYAFSITGELKPLVAFSNPSAGPQIFDGQAMTHLWGSKYASIGGGLMPTYITPRLGTTIVFGNNVVIPGRINGDGTCEFFWIQSGWNLADGTPIDPCIDVWRITVPAGFDYELMYTIPIKPILGDAVTSVFMGRAEYDRAADNIIMIIGTSNIDMGDIISVGRGGFLNWHTTGVLYTSFGPINSGQSLLLGSTFAWIYGGPWVIDTTTGAIIEHESLAGPVGSPTESGWASYNSSQMTVYAMAFGDPDVTVALFPRTLGKFLVNRGSGSTVKLSQIVQDLSVEAGLSADKIDVASLDDDVLGYSRVQETARSLISDLCTAYFWDYVESDYRLIAKKRGSAPVATIPYANLLPQGDNAAALPLQRNQAEALPRRAWVRYSDIDHDQQQGTQQFARAEAPANASVTNSAGELTLDFRLVMNAGMAKTLAKRRLMMLWSERELFQQIGLPPAYIALDPADVVILQGRDGFAWRARIDKVSLGADYSLQCEGAVEDPNLLTVTAEAFGGSGVTPTLIPTPYTPVGIQPEMPLLRDGDDAGGLELREYGAIGAYRGQTFGGATMFISPDGVSWAQLLASSKPMTWGTTLNALPPPAMLYTTDTINHLDVTMSYGGELLESATTAQVLEGVNPAILITAAGEVELFQYTTVTPIGSIYRLTGLLRGRKGSEWAVGNHHAGEKFIAIDPTAWRIASVPLAFYNTTRYEKTVGLGDIFDSVFPVPRLFKGTAEKPYAPVRITSTRDLITNDLTIGWQRRTRIGGEWIDGTETPPLGEAAELYDIDILATDLTVIRMLHSTTNAVVYTDADQTTDGLDDSPVVVAIYQVSAIVGRGYPAYANLPAPDGDTGVPTVTLTNITLSPSTVPAGVMPPANVGTMTVSTTGGPFTGAISLAGPDAGSFVAAGTILRTANTLAAGSYHITMVASQTGAVHSPMGVPAVIVASTTGSPTINSITLSSTSFVSGTAGLAVATITVAMSSGSFVGTMALSGTDAASFVLTGNVLTTASALLPRSYAITLTAAQTGASNSPFAHNFSLTATTTLNSIGLSNTTVASSAPTGTVVGAITVSTTGTFTGSLSLSGTDAAKFAISSGDLVTATSLLAGFYSINIIATQSGAVHSPLTRGFTISAAAGGSIIAPSQAVSAGYSTMVWDDDFTDATTIASTQGATTGFKWYWAQRNGSPPDPTEWSVNETATAASITNGNTGGGSNASPDGGILTISDGIFPNASIMTLPGWALNAGTTTMPAIGNGRWQQMYVEAYIQFKPDQNASVIYTSTGWPAFWSWAAEGLDDFGFPGSGFSTTNTTEVDFLESFGNTQWPGVGGGGTSSGPANTDQSTIINHTSNAANVFASISPIDSEWHTYGFLWTPGHVAIYLDNVLRGSLSLAPDYTALDVQSLFLVLGTGPSWVMNIDWVRVWQ